MFQKFLSLKVRDQKELMVKNGHGNHFQVMSGKFY